MSENNHEVTVKSDGSDCSCVQSVESSFVGDVDSTLSHEEVETGKISKVIFMSLDVAVKCLALSISSFIFLISLHHFCRLRDYMSGLSYKGYLHIQASFYYFLVYFVAFCFFVDDLRCASLMILMVFFYNTI